MSTPNNFIIKLTMGKIINRRSGIARMISSHPKNLAFKKLCAVLYDKKKAKIFEPSKGGMGIKLKIQRTRLMAIP